MMMAMTVSANGKTILTLTIPGNPGKKSTTQLHSRNLLSSTPLIPTNTFLQDLTSIPVHHTPVLEFPLQSLLHPLLVLQLSQPLSLSDVPPTSRNPCRRSALKRELLS
jgi:hypothetical protein